MHFLGIFLSVGALVLILVLEAGRDFISTTYSLSPEITILILINIDVSIINIIDITNIINIIYTRSPLA